MPAAPRAPALLMPEAPACAAPPLAPGAPATAFAPATPLPAAPALEVAPAAAIAPALAPAPALDLPAALELAPVPDVAVLPPFAATAPDTGGRAVVPALPTMAGQFVAFTHDDRGASCEQ
ncbi:MAG TPA: hypothetical protein VJR89_11365 [Polyangiales bacterium]|nr:hypothetical protein [Polyangiales bacterium]